MTLDDSLTRLRRSFRAIGAWLVWAASRILPIAKVRGFELISLVGPHELDNFGRRVGDALELIESLAPNQFARVRRYVRRFGLISKGGDHYSHFLEAHIVSLDWLIRMDTGSLALNIVHEATHARLASRGITPSRANIARIEALCVKEEMTFARRLPDGEARARRIEAMLDTQWWSSDEARLRARERMESVGTPPWMMRLVIRAKFGRERLR